MKIASASYRIQALIGRLTVCIAWLCLANALFSLVGCGGGLSQSDLARYARTSSDDEDDEDEDDDYSQPARTAPATPPVANTPPSNPPAADAQPNAPANPTNAVAANPTAPTAAPSNASPANTTPRATTNSASPASATTPAAQSPIQAASAGPAIAGILPIAARKPATELELAERRKRSAANVQKLATTLKTWIDTTPMIQTSVVRDQTRRPGLSWRVKLLPLLGYDELFKKFNLKEPWDSPTNKPLLEYIPDEFVSPERFDTYTNYQMFVNGTALFSDIEMKHRSDISDAPLVLLLAEVDDAAAVPWTAPFDYEVETEEPLDRALGNLRDDGVFVGWLTGNASVWPTPINTDTLYKAITFEAGDNMNFGPMLDYPQDVIGKSGRPTLGSVASTPRRPPTNTPSASASTTSGSVAASTGGNYPNRGRTQVARQAVPSRESIIEAEAKMRETYSGALKQARTPGEMAKLAQTIFTQMMGTGTRTSSVNEDDDDYDYSSTRTVSMPPPELFVGLRSALNIAVRGRDANLALQLLDELDMRFEIDRAEYEGNMFNGFLGKKGSLRTELTKASLLIPYLEQTVVRLVEQDDYKAAEQNLEYGTSVVRNMNNRETNYRWKVLKQRVEEGRKRFPRVAKAIQTLDSNPSDPAANLAVGWYLCLVKNNWVEGAELLAKSNDDSLRALAILEIQQDNNQARLMSLGDGWWNYGEKNKDDALVFEAAMKRARKWYLAASASLPDGLDRIRANSRLEQIDRMIGREEITGANGMRTARGSR
ncbi:MAG: hypothetical protein ACE361_20355 [Aureliella sp.]